MRNVTHYLSWKQFTKETLEMQNHFITLYPRDLGNHLEHVFIKMPIKKLFLVIIFLKIHRILQFHGRHNLHNKSRIILTNNVGEDLLMEMYLPILILHNLKPQTNKNPINNLNDHINNSHIKILTNETTYPPIYQ